MILVRNKYISCQVNIAATIVEQVFARVTVRGNKYIIGSVYIPPGSSSEVYNSHCAPVQDSRMKSNRLSCVETTTSSV